MKENKYLLSKNDKEIVRLFTYQDKRTQKFAIIKTTVLDEKEYVLCFGDLEDLKVVAREIYHDTDERYQKIQREKQKLKENIHEIADLYNGEFCEK